MTPAANSESSNPDANPVDRPFNSESGAAEIQSHNQAAWDRLVSTKNRFTKPASDEDFNNPLSVVDGCGWLGGNIHGKRVLCLAAGGGRQGPLHAAAGADVTVVDISNSMLVIDREVAAERNLSLQTVLTSMDDLSMFANGSFDIVIQPVSTCYVPDIAPVYLAVARVLRGGGLFISQHKQPASLQASQQPVNGNYVFETPYYTNCPLPSGQPGSLVREPGTQEFLHRWEQIVGWMCRAGFVIEDLVEPVHSKPNAPMGSFAHHSTYTAPYVRIKARRVMSDKKLFV